MLLKRLPTCSFSLRLLGVSSQSLLELPLSYLNRRHYRHVASPRAVLPPSIHNHVSL